MWRVYGGALLVIAGIAAFIEAHAHVPVAASNPAVGYDALELSELARKGVDVSAQPASGLSPTGYDLLRIGGWALVILGAVTVLLGLLSYRRSAANH